MGIIFLCLVLAVMMGILMMAGAVIAYLIFDAVKERSRAK